MWSRKCFLRWDILDNSVGILRELEFEQVIEYRSFIKITPDQFKFLLQKVSPIFQREDIIIRSAIPARIKLEFTLSFLATGNSYHSLSYFILEFRCW